VKTTYHYDEQPLFYASQNEAMSATSEIGVGYGHSVQRLALVKLG